MILAKKVINGKVHERKFNEYAWELLGKDTNGWERVSNTPNLPPPAPEIKQFLAEPKKKEVVPPVVKKPEPVIELVDEPVRVDEPVSEKPAPKRGRKPGKK